MISVASGAGGQREIAENDIKLSLSMGGGKREEFQRKINDFAGQWGWGTARNRRK